MWGYDFQNNYTQNAQFEISQAYTYFYFTMNGLLPSTNYTAFLAAGSAHPGYPDLIANKDVV